MGLNFVVSFAQNVSAHTLFFQQRLSNSYKYGDMPQNVDYC